MAPFTVQLIDRKRHFNIDRLKRFVTETKLSRHGNSYSVVSVLGPQSSGKSTLLNCLFGTNFKVMGTFGGEFQTTQGIWMAKCRDIQPFTIVMDMEGTDGSVKEGDTTFDKQSALFALEISNVVMINTWWKDVGRHEAGHRELLKTVFKFMVQLLKPHKTTLLFVLRDKGTKIPFEKIETYLNEDIEKIWNGVPKPDAHRKAPLSKFFEVKITALSSYEDKEERFKQEVAQMRKPYFSSAAKRDVSASEFSDYANNTWKLITQIPDLKTPNLQILVATVRCEAIVKQELDRLSAAQLYEAIKVGPGKFAEELRSILKNCRSNYNEKTKYYDEGIRTAKKKDLEAKALERLRPAYIGMLKCLFVEAFESFSTGLEETLNKRKDFAASVHTLENSCVLQFETGCKEATIKRANWDDASLLLELLTKAIKAHASSVKGQAKSQGNSAQPYFSVLSAIAQAIAAGTGLASVLACGGACNII